MVNIKTLFSIKIFIAILLLTSTYSFSQDDFNVNYHGRIDVLEYNAEIVKSRCFFRDGGSSVSKHSIDSNAHGGQNQHNEKFVFNGETYFQREVKWQTDKTSHSFTLSFHADDANFYSSPETSHDSFCFYRVRALSTSSSETILASSAVFTIPQNSWVIKISSKTKGIMGKVDFTLRNNEIVAGSDEKNPVFETKKIEEFQKTEYETYFLVNPSTSEFSNFIFLDFVYRAQTLHEQNLDLDFKIEFIAADNCLNQLGGVHFGKVLEKDILDNNLDQALNNMACMLNPRYVSHYLSTVHLYGLDDFFQKISLLEKTIYGKQGSKLSASDLYKLDILLTLTERIRFYYSFELLKEVFSVASNKVLWGDESLNLWKYLEILRQRSFLYLSSVFDDLFNTFNSLPRESIYVILPSEEQEKLSFFLNYIIPQEIESFNKIHSLLPMPQYLARVPLDLLQDSVARTIKTSNELINLSQNIVKKEKIVSAQLEHLKQKLRTLHLNFTQYSESIRSINHGKQDKLTWEEKKTDLMLQIESIYHINLVSTFSNLNAYFKKYFEDPLFKNISINGKYYKNAELFMQDFKTLFSEAFL